MVQFSTIYNNSVPIHYINNDKFGTNVIIWYIEDTFVPCNKFVQSKQFCTVEQIYTN